MPRSRPDLVQRTSAGAEPRRPACRATPSASQAALRLARSRAERPTFQRGPTPRKPQVIVPQSSAHHCADSRSPSSRRAQLVHRFAGFTLDPRQRVLLRSNSPVPLPPKAVELLELLVESAPRVATKQEI